HYDQKSRSAYYQAPDGMSLYNSKCSISLSPAHFPSVENAHIDVTDQKEWSIEQVSNSTDIRIIRGCASEPPMLQLQCRGDMPILIPDSRIWTIGNILVLSSPDSAAKIYVRS